MSGDTEREALIRILVEVERGKMTEVEWKVASLTPANGIRADAILAKFLPAHDERVRAIAWRKGVEDAQDELVRRDQFSARTLDILDKLVRRES